MQAFPGDAAHGALYSGEFVKHTYPELRERYATALECVKLPHDVEELRSGHLGVGGRNVDRNSSFGYFNAVHQVKQYFFDGSLSGKSATCRAGFRRLVTAF